MEIIVSLLIMVLCLGAEAFFSGSEIGVVSADRIKLRHQAAKGSRGARLALKMLEKPEWLLSTTLVGTNIAVVTNTTIATALMIQLFGEEYGWLAIPVVAPLIWIFGEIVSKSVFQQRADSLTPRVAFILHGASYIFLPILLVFSGISGFLTRLLGDQGSQNPFTLREEISAMMDMSAADGDILPMERRMIRRMFNFGETTAKDIMVPMVDVVAVALDECCGEARRIAVARAHKRLPVFDQRIDRIIGTLNVLDLLVEAKGKPVTPFVKPAHFVPDTVSVETLLSDFRQGAGNMAVVVDEYGGAKGIVMLEDILEVIVGDLEDEFDAPAATGAWLHRFGEHDYLVSGQIELTRLKEELGLELPPGRYRTLAGFLMDATQSIPPVGAVIRYQEISFTIERATAQAAQEVRIRW